MSQVQVSLALYLLGLPSVVALGERVDAALAWGADGAGPRPSSAFVPLPLVWLGLGRATPFCASLPILYYLLSSSLSSNIASPHPGNFNGAVFVLLLVLLCFPY